ncbi:MAG TPA: preprotein translocase subunit YajC [Gaiellaceae bacterium]|nr:preprotein translocase subunit YajC [Gaiellaceae bacterium]
MSAGPLIFLVALVAVLWFVLIRPQRQRQATHRALLQELAVDDEVVTAGGIFGRVRSVADDHIMLEIAPGTQVRVAKEAITGVIRQDEQEDEQLSAEAENPG